MLRAPSSSAIVSATLLMLVLLSADSLETVRGDPAMEAAASPEPETSARPSIDRLPALTAPRRIATLSATRAGKIAEVRFEEGDQVRQGERVFLLDDRVQRARTEIAEANAGTSLEVDIARSAWDQAIYHLERFRQLDGDRNAASKEVTDAAAITRTRELEYHQAEFTQQQDHRLLKLEQALLDEYVGYAPFDGYVISRHKQTGESANELEPIITLAQVDPIQITVDVPLEQARSIAVGQTLIVETDGLEATQRTATVEIKAPAADPAAQTVRIKLQVANADLSLIPGSKVYVIPGGVQAQRTDSATPGSTGER